MYALWGLVFAVAACSDSLFDSDGGKLYSHFTAATLEPGDTLQLGFIVEGRSMPNPAFGREGRPWGGRTTVSSSGGAVVDVESGGKLIARAAGEAVVRVEVAGATASLDLVVRDTSEVRARYAHIGLRRGHTCVLDPAGRAFCWGDNYFGQLGTGFKRRYTQFLSPQPVRTALRFQALAPSGMHSCGLGMDGQVFCWGRNDRGQLGDGTHTDRVVPTRVLSAERFVQLAAGDGHTCALTADGRAFCWGSNSMGELGVGANRGLSDHSTSPVAVAGQARFASLALGSRFSCGLTREGLALCWGANHTGQLGTGMPQGASLPAPVATPFSFHGLSAGTDHACGVTPQHQALCWGGNSHGQLGNGTQLPSSTPTPVSGSAAYVAVVAAFRHSCGMTPEGAAECWGSNWEGQLGTGTGGPGTGETSLVAQPVYGGVRFLSLAAGETNSCGISHEGVAYCWGAGMYNFGGGSIGDGRPGGSNRPRAVAAPFPGPR